jgi:hypothetical protein
LKYFTIEENKKIKNVPIVSNWYETSKRLGININEFNSINDKIILKISSNKETIFTSVMTHPFFMIHNDIFKIVKKYEPSILSKKIILLDSENSFSELYQITLLPYLDCIDKDKKKYEKIVLDELKMQGRKKRNIFWIKGHDSNVPIISLELAESILRREPKGIQLTEVEISYV